MPAPNIQGELALAAVGLSAIIEGEMPKMGVMRIENAIALPKKIKGLAYDAVCGKLKYYPDKRKHSYSKLLERMTEGNWEEKVESLIQSFPIEAGDMATEFSIVVQQSMEALKRLIPVSTIVTFTGPRNISPSDDRLWKFFNQLELLNDPLKIFNMISAGALLKSQAEAVREIYPTLSDAFDNALYAGVAEEVAKKPKFQLVPRVEYGLGNWLGRRTVEYQPPKPLVEPEPRKMQSGDAEQLKTEVQKSNTT